MKQGREKSIFDKEVMMSVRKTRHTVAEYRRVLTSIFELMLASGVVKEEILRTAGVALSRAKAAERDQKKDLAGALTIAALVLDAWHRDRLYLTSSGRPRALKLWGPAPSVEALVRSQPGRHRATALVHRLQSQGFILSCGRDLFKPANNIALLSALDPVATEHIARSLSALLATIRQNLTAKYTAERVIERFAEVPDLPVKQLQSFRRFTQIQGGILLRTVNDWLEARRLKDPAPGEKTVRAGIHVHAYLAGAIPFFRDRKSSPTQELANSSRNAFLKIFPTLVLGSSSRK